MSNKNASISRKNLDRLDEIKDEMLELLEEAADIVKDSGSFERQRMKSNWYARVKIALVNEHEYVGGSMCSMEDTIEALEGVVSDEDEEDWDSEEDLDDNA